MKTIICFVLFVAAVQGLPQLFEASTCSASSCKIENECRCASTANPVTSSSDPAPQFIALTVSESVVTTLYTEYLKPLLFNRKNPDGRSISASFYVNHEYTDYTLVQDLYLRGFEIGVHSITKNSSQEYWRSASLEELIEEFYGQRQIISHFANIPIDDLVGARTPQLQIEGDLSITAYEQSGIEYDNSWSTRTTQPLLPYTLDYKSTQECLTTITCPTESHQHFWIAPLTNIKGSDDVECNSIATCLVEGTPREIADWLIAQVDHFHNGNRAPLVLRLDSYWFQFTKNSFEGFTLFLDDMQKRSDVFFVSVGDILEWIKNPIPVSKYQTPIYVRSAACNEISCALKFNDGSERYMKSCVPCPKQYPWLKNPYGQ